MSSLTRSQLFTGVAFSLSILMAAGCSSGSDDESGAVPDGEPGTDNPDDVIVDGPAPTTPLITPVTARAIAIESLELADSLVYLFSDDNLQPTSAGSGSTACAGGLGSVSITVAPEQTSQTFEFLECELDGNSPVQLNGLMVLTGTFDNGFSGTKTFVELEVTTGIRTVLVNGSASVNTTPGSVAVSQAELVVNDSQSDAVLMQSSFSIDNAGTLQQNVQMDLVLDAPRFGLSGTQVQSSGLGGQFVACPQSGSLSVDAGDEGSLVVNGITGDNLTFEVDGAIDTLACSEVASISRPPTNPLLTPPAVPGGDPDFFRS